MRGWLICEVGLYGRSAYMRGWLICEVGLYARLAYVRVYTVSKCYTNNIITIPNYRNKPHNTQNNDDNIIAMQPTWNVLKYKQMQYSPYTTFLYLSHGMN